MTRPLCPHGRQAQRQVVRPRRSRPRRPRLPETARIPDGPALDALATALRPWLAASRHALADRKDP